MKRLSIATKSMLITSIIIVLVGAVFIEASYVIQGRVLSKQFRQDSEKLIVPWSQGLSNSDMSDIYQKHMYDKNSPIQKKWTAYLDDISTYNPNVGQAYVFGVELRDGNLTTLISQPTHILNMMEQRGLRLGGYLDQPEHIVKGIEQMLKTKKTVFTQKYNDTVGTWVTVLSPIKDSDGHIFAYFAIDIDASMIDKGQQMLFLYEIPTLIILLLICLTLQYLNHRATFKPLTALVEAIDQVGKGNYNPNLGEGPDELGQINARFNTMMSHIRHLLTTIGSVSAQLSDSSEKLHLTAEYNKKTAIEIASDIEEIADAAQKQELSTKESSLSLDSMTVNISTIACNTSEVAVTSMEAQMQSQDGDEFIQRVAQTMLDIDTNSDTATGIIEDIHTTVVELIQNLAVLGNISNETDTLLNIIEQENKKDKRMDKNFVDATYNLRSLAAQGKESSERITSIMDFLNIRKADAIEGVKFRTDKVKSGLDLAQNTGQSFSRIFESNHIVADRLQDIAASTEEMAAETKEISNVVKQLSEVAQCNATRASNISSRIEEQLESNLAIADSSSQLKEISDELQQILNTINITGGKHSGGQ